MLAHLGGKANRLSFVRKAAILCKSQTGWCIGYWIGTLNAPSPSCRVIPPRFRWNPPGGRGTKPPHESATGDLRAAPASGEFAGSTPNVHPGNGMQNAKNIQEPQGQANHHDRVQKRLNGLLHGDEPVHQPEQKTHHDNDNQYL
jgi:hypothetical protein